MCPDSALTMNGEFQTPTILGRGLDKPGIDCVAGELLANPGDFVRIHIRSGTTDAPTAPHGGSCIPR